MAVAMNYLLAVAIDCLLYSMAVTMDSLPWFIAVAMDCLDMTSRDFRPEMRPACVSVHVSYLLRWRFSTFGRAAAPS